MNFFNSITNLLGMISSSNIENVLVTVLILTESFLIYFNIRMFKLMTEINLMSDSVNRNFNILKTILRLITILGNNQQLMFDYIQNKKLHVSKMSVPNFSEDDKQ